MWESAFQFLLTRCFRSPDIAQANVRLANIVGKSPVLAIDEPPGPHAIQSNVVAMQAMVFFTPIESLLGLLPIEVTCAVQLASTSFCELLVPKKVNQG
jgi:hypothetical protein